MEIRNRDALRLQLVVKILDRVDLGDEDEG